MVNKLYYAFDQDGNLSFFDSVINELPETAKPISQKCWETYLDNQDLYTIDPATGNVLSKADNTVVLVNEEAAVE